MMRAVARRHALRAHGTNRMH